MMVRLLSETTPLEQFIGFYGNAHRSGLISEHVELFKSAGGEIRKGNAHAGWAVIEGKAYPILCSEIVRIDTEDGPVSGRCGEFALPISGRCAYHEEAYIGGWED